MEEQNLNNIPQWEWTEVELKRAIWSTRQEKGGIAIHRIAEIIAEEFDGAELEALAEKLELRAKTKL